MTRTNVVALAALLAAAVCLLSGLRYSGHTSVAGGEQQTSEAVGLTGRVELEPVLNPSLDRVIVGDPVGFSLRVVLREGRTLESDEDTKSAAGASFVCRKSGSRDRYARATADLEGTIRLPVGIDPVEFAVWHRYGVRVVVNDAAGVAGTTIALEPAGALLVSVPAARVPYRVVVEPRAGGARPVRANSVDGFTTVEGVPAQWRDVVVRAVVEGNTIGVADARVEAGRDVSVVLAAVSPCQVRATIVTEAGAPVVGAFATLVPMDDVRVSERCRQAESDRAGLLVMHAVDPVRMKFMVRKRNYGGLNAAVEVDASSGGDVDLGRIVLPRGRVVRGRVRFKARGGATLKTRYPDLCVRATTWPSASAGLTRAAAMTGLSVSVGEDGRFELRGLREGPQMVYAMPSGGRSSWSGTVVQIGKSDIDGVEIDLLCHRPWECEVKTVLGEPLQKGEVMAASMLSNWFARAPIDADGRANLIVGDGDFLVGVRSSLDVRWIQVCQGSSTRESITMPDGRLELVGLDLAGAGDLVWSHVTVTYLGGQLGAEWLPVTMTCGPLKPNPAGRFLVRYLLPGEYRLEVRAQPWGRRELSFQISRGEHATRGWPYAR